MVLVTVLGAYPKMIVPGLVPEGGTVLVYPGSPLPKNVVETSYGGPISVTVVAEVTVVGMPMITVSLLPDSVTVVVKPGSVEGIYTVCVVAS